MDTKEETIKNYQINCYLCNNDATRKCMKCRKLLCIFHTEYIKKRSNILDSCIDCFEESNKVKNKYQELIIIIKILLFISLLMLFISIINKY